MLTLFSLGLFTCVSMYAVHLKYQNHEVNASLAVSQANLLDTQTKLGEAQSTIESLCHIQHTPVTQK